MKLFLLFIISISIYVQSNEMERFDLNYQNENRHFLMYVPKSDKKINKMYLDSKPMIISNLDSLEYNQIKGKIMIGNFKDNKLKTMNVSGNGQSIYFLKEKEETIGMNYLESSSINLHFIDKKINNINYEVIPHSLTTPIEDLKNEDRFLKEFEWRIKEKPTKKEIINQ